jgi:hypothetical protein
MLLCIYNELLPLLQPPHRPILVVIVVVVLLLDDLLELVVAVRALSLAAA